VFLSFVDDVGVDVLEERVRLAVVTETQDSAEPEHISLTVVLECLLVKLIIIQLHQRRHKFWIVYVIKGRRDNLSDTVTFTDVVCQAYQVDFLSFFTVKVCGEEGLHGMEVRFTLRLVLELDHNLVLSYFRLFHLFNLIIPSDLELIFPFFLFQIEIKL